jgi:hypothetical protein
MILNNPSQTIPDEALIDGLNLFVTQEGLKKRGGFRDAFSVTSTDTPLRDIGNLWLPTGLQKTWLVGDKYLYDLSLGSAIASYSTYDTGTIELSGLTLTGSSTVWTEANIREGDIVILDADGTPEEAVISVVNSDTSITLTEAPSGTYAAGTDYEIRRIFQPSYPQKLQYEVIDGLVIFTDFARIPLSWDGTDLEPYFSTTTYYIGSICYWKERLWGLRILEDDGDYRARVRWTTATDRTEFPISQYQDLDYTSGAGQRIIGLGEVLVVFMTDAIYMGTASNIPSLPAVFNQIETGGVGLVGQRALAKYLDGVFFVGQDNIYYLSSQGVNPVGDVIIQESLKKCTKVGNIQLVYDPKNECLWCGFPIGGETITDIFTLNIRSKAWSRVEKDADVLATLNLVFFINYENWMTAVYETGSVTTVDESTTIEGTGVDWVTATVEAGDYILFDVDEEGVYYKSYEVDSVTDLDTLEVTTAVDFDSTTIPYRIVKADQTYTDLGIYPSYDAIKNEVEGLKDFYISDGGVVKSLTEASADISGNILFSFITKDFDFGVPDKTKFFNRLTIKIREDIPEDIVFNFYGSTDKGRTWKHLGANTLEAGKDEVRIDFRLTGSIGRFKVTSDTPISSPFLVEEMVLRIRSIGLEVTGRNG